MPRTRELTADKLYNRCDPSQFKFRTTAELADFDGVLGQKRAMEAINFATDEYRWACQAPRSVVHRIPERRPIWQSTLPFCSQATRL